MFESLTKAHELYTLFTTKSVCFDAKNEMSGTKCNKMLRNASDVFWYKKEKSGTKCK